MGQPSLIKVQRIDQVAKFGLDRFYVVNHTVIGALCQRQNTRVLIFDIARKRIGIDFFLDACGLKFLKRNRANNAHMVARGT